MKPEVLAELKEHCEKLLALLTDPQPGLFTWSQITCRRWALIAYLWDPDQFPKGKP